MTSLLLLMMMSSPHLLEAPPSERIILQLMEGKSRIMRSPNRQWTCLKKQPEKMEKMEQLKPTDMDPKQTVADASAGLSRVFFSIFQMSIEKKMNILELMQKPKGTKLVVPDGYTVQCSRGKLGESLQQGTTQFHLRERYMRQNPCKYSCLHDKHLKKFFYKPERRKQLIKQGLITEDGYVLCSEDEFHQYIDYLKLISPRDKLPQIDVRVSGKTLEVFLIHSPSLATQHLEDGKMEYDIPAGPKKVKFQTSTAGSETGLY